MPMTSVNLVSHRGCVPIKREDLVAIVTPTPLSPRHRPISHLELIEGIESSLASRGVMVAKEELAINRNGALLFGVMDLRWGDTGVFCAALGIRTSNDMRFAVQIIVGARVFACDNLAFSGDIVTMKRRHVISINLKRELDEASERFFERYSALQGRLEAMMQEQISDVTAKSILHDAAVSGVIPLRLLPIASKAYFNPAIDFQPRTAWSLHNAITGAIRTLPASSGMASGIALAKLFRT